MNKPVYLCLSVDERVYLGLISLLRIKVMYDSNV